MPQLSFRKLSCQSARSKRTLEDDEKVSIYFLFNIDKWAKEQGASGLAYFTLEKEEKIKGKGPVGKFFSSDALEEIMKMLEI